ncbi:hypothetical protein L0Y49_03280 [bacterium]|nr:hypothetical protein [bacterium]MCI0566528.1 hypothetical protein [bacterium]
MDEKIGAIVSFLLLCKKDDVIRLLNNFFGHTKIFSWEQKHHTMGRYCYFGDRAHSGACYTRQKI